MLFFTAKTKERVSTARLTPKEISELSAFAKEHHHDVHRLAFDLTFHETGVAAAVDVVCLHCGEKTDITDYDSW